MLTSFKKYLSFDYSLIINNTVKTQTLVDPHPIAQNLSFDAPGQSECDAVVSFISEH